MRRASYAKIRGKNSLAEEIANAKALGWKEPGLFKKQQDVIVSATV